MIDVGVSRHEVLALRQAKIHLPDDVDNVIDGVFVADVDQHPFLGIMHEIDTAPQAPAGLVVHFDDVREEFRTLSHEWVER